jgi:RHS repeat-associated protein
LASPKAVPLAATSLGNAMFYLYTSAPLSAGARGKPVAEQVVGWSYYLNDGLNVPRQMSDGNGAVTLMREYTPWGEVLKQAGTGNFTWGYFGGLMDAATGLLYVGGGQYYDPASGRFLTPANRNGNPYLPGRIDPTAGLLGSATLLALVFRRRRKPGKYDTLVVTLVLAFGLGIGLAGCGGGGGTSTPTWLPPTLPPTGTCTPAVTPGPTETPIPHTPTPQKTKVILNCGLRGSSPDEPGMECRYASPGQLGEHKAYWEGKLGADKVDVQYFNFPGNTAAAEKYQGDGKFMQSEEALRDAGVDLSAPVIFGGYSAGGDAAILEAYRAKFELNWNVTGLYLIDPGYETPTVDTSQLTGKIQSLVNQGVPVIVVDAPAYLPPDFTQINPLTVLNLDQKISGTSFHYDYNATYNHLAIDNTAEIFDLIYRWLTTLQA